MPHRLTSLVVLIAVSTGLIMTAKPVLAESPEVAIIRPDLQTAFANGGWNLDRYSDLNEVDIDGRPRQLDYLGTENSLTFSWGFQQPFAGLRAGMTLVKADVPCVLSIYRFHDHQPIRFNKSLHWHINWSQEKHVFINKDWNPKWEEVIAKGGAWVDYASVYYWYQSVPGGFKHEPLPPVAERAKQMIKPEPKPTDEANKK